MKSTNKGRVNWLSGVLLRKATTVKVSSSSLVLSINRCPQTRGVCVLLDSLADTCLLHFNANSERTGSREAETQLVGCSRSARTLRILTVQRQDFSRVYHSNRRIKKIQKAIDPLNNI